MIKVDELGDRNEFVRLREAVATLATTANLDEFVGTAFAKRQCILARLGRSVANEERSIRRIFHQIVDLFTSDVAPVPVSFVERAQLEIARTNH